MGQRTAGDLMFEAYLAEQGFGEIPHVPDLGVGKIPDYVIERDGQRCVVEVKEFAPESSPFPTGRGYGSLDSATLLKRIRAQLREAARKFKPMEHLGLPLVVMLANPNRVLLDLSIENIIYSMYGDLTFTFPVSVETGGATEPGQFVAGRNGRYRADHQYVSAVGVLRCRSRRAEHVQTNGKPIRSPSTKRGHVGPGSVAPFDRRARSDTWTAREGSQRCVMSS
jgi:hypothetical protein